MKDREFYFVFMDTEPCDGPKWHRVFTSEGWRHCMVIMQLGGETVSLDPQHYGLQLKGYYGQLNDGMAVPADMVAGSYADVGHTVVKWNNDNFGGHNVYGFGTLIPSCVSFCKVTAGIKSLSLTPKQLFRWLLKNGGEIVDGRPG